MNIQIPSARVPLIDPRTGLITQEWFVFLFSLQTSILTNETAIDVLEAAFSTAKAKITDVGGFAVKYINKTGAASIKGYCVTTGSANDSVILTPIGVPNGIGVFLDSGVADGAEAWVVTKGKAYGYFNGSTTFGYLARTPIAADAGGVAGQLISEAIPTSPFATDKHFCEMGHLAETRTGAGLALFEVHQN
jgi:hypothetical protein